MEKTTPIVKLSHVEVNFNKKTGLFRKADYVNALHDINLSIYPGEVVVLVGESGSGKTTMANVIAGIVHPTSGKVFFKGTEVPEMNQEQKEEYRNNIQMVQQDSYASLNPMRRMIKILGDPLVIKKYSDKKNVEEKVSHFLNTVELTPAENFLQKYPHQLSGGQRQRMLIARAISMNPKLLLADEPVSMIDVSLRVSVLNLLAKLNQEDNIAIAYITHDLATARYVGQNGRIEVMYMGEIVESGRLQEVLSHPKHPYLRALLNAVPIPDPKIARQPRETSIKTMEEIEGTIPSGCRFHNRCRYCKEICKEKKPAMEQHGSSMVACHRTAELPPFTLYQNAREDANLEK
ncbi:ABC transporter ATP-binding protein [Eubacteriales bacterium mix99]|jgi:peptide/nickel transport system ATP-binding protein